MSFNGTITKFIGFLTINLYKITKTFFICYSPKLLFVPYRKELSIFLLLRKTLEIKAYHFLFISPITFRIVQNCGSQNWINWMVLSTNIINQNLDTKPHSNFFIAVIVLS